MLDCTIGRRLYLSLRPAVKHSSWITTLQANGQKGVLATVLWKVVPPSCVALLAIWLLVGVGGAWVLNQRNVESLKAAAEQQTWAVADKIDYFYNNLRGIADNALTINAFVDPLSVEHFLQPFFRSFRIGGYSSLAITMTDFTGLVMASNLPMNDVVDLPPRDLWLTPAIAGKDVLTIHDGSLTVAVPVTIGQLPEGVILVTLSPVDTEALLSSKKHDGQVKLFDQDRGVIYDSHARTPSSGDVIESVPIPLPDFPGLLLSSTIADQEKNPFIGLLHGFLLIAFLANLIALAFGIFMAANLVASPLNHLVTRIQSMQKLTDPVERLAVEGPLELRNLALTFNEAADRQAELTSSLEEALASEKKINESQRQFVSMLSHEFRTPLAIIDGIAQRTIRRIETEPKEGIVASMEKCRSSVTRLIGMIESILNSSRIEAGVIDFHPGPCKLAELLVDVAKGQEGITPGHQMVLDIGQLPEDIVADESLMRQIFTNLFSNAVKYSPNTSKVWVDGRRDGRDAVITIRDQGVGIPEEEIDKLFARFFRASTARGIAGTGIGLYLVKQLVEMHHGGISVTSVEGEGTTFTLRLPIDPSSDMTARAA